MNATFSATSVTGFTKLTTFVFTDTSSPIENVVFHSWNLGDGNFAAGNVVSHVYEVPGTYNVKLTITDTSGETSSTVEQIIVDNVIKEAIQFTQIPPPSEQGQLQIYPFRVEISAPDSDDHFLDLYSQFSKSAPLQQKTRWSNLQPQWRFLDTD